ncbi:MAG: hypothetical protein GTN89_09175 [Acidobacteria bacterium]|nr:hypothetical protein [Acidobacteriota bacterium]NIM60525.1 hypothetical protein [Acidobacteriota bacterium]NIO59496.1 hypothetical protein [Acidobacteriota bacterium]NIQ30525.1 hypothetical protein [Acidobacteriota bacterium]NIQ85473.1 hypothetical protein [Acidobacteriota bacterium]
MREPKTLAEQISVLAQLTGAPQTFVLQVKELFSRKGIPLDSDAGPYLKALEEAFKREESIRCTTERARDNIKRLQNNFNRIGEAYVKQLAELNKLRGGAQKKKGAAGSSEVQIPGGNHRSFVTPAQSDKFPMVPGPKEEQ